MGRIRVVRQHEYLGTIISYYSPADLTFAHRLKAGKEAFGRLRRWWKKGSLSLPDRLRLWKTCVWPCLTYSLSTVGLSDTSQAQLRGIVCRQVRNIAAERWVNDELSAVGLLKRHGLADPVLEVSRQFLQHWLRRRDSFRHLSPQDILRSDKHQPLACTWYMRWSSFAYDMVARAGEHMAKYSHLPRDQTTPMLALPSPSRLTCQLCQTSFPSMRSLRVHQGRMHKDISEQKGSFDRATDSHAGMPICRWCGIKFSHWPGLQVHHESNSCRGKHQLNEGEQIVTHQAPALRFHPVARALLSDLPMTSLELSDTTLRSLSEHCVICHQWTNRPTSLAKHINTHLSRDALRQAQQLYMQFTTHCHFLSPCEWCRRVVSCANKHRCLVFWQRAAFQAWFSLQQSQQNNAGAGGEHDHAARDREHPGTPDGQAQHNSGVKSSLSSKETQNRSRRRLRIRKKSRPRAADGEIVSSSRGRLVRPSVGHQLRSVRANPHRGFDAVHCTVLIFGGCGMEKSQRREGSLSATSQCLIADDDRDPSQACGGDQGAGARIGELQEAPCTPDSRRQRLLSIPDVESECRETDSRFQSSCSDIGRGLWNFEHDQQRHGGHKDNHEVSQCSTTITGSQGTDLAILLVRELANRACGLNACSIHEIERQRSLDISCCTPQTRDAEEESVGGADIEADSGTPLGERLSSLEKWQVINDGNMCYLDTIWLCLLWVHTHVSLSLKDICSPMRHMLQMALACQPGLLRPIVRAFHYGWQNERSQNDVAEYYSHLMSTAAVDCGGWEARLMVDMHSICADSGSLRQPLGLVVPGDAEDTLSLSECLLHWHLQLHCHALVAAPDWIMMQYPRFRTEEGLTSRCHRALYISEDFTIPCFRNGSLDVYWERYLILGLILHKGGSPCSGHYVCLLRRHGSHSWTEKDDLKKELGRVYPDVSSLPSMDIYMIIAVRTQALTGESA